MGGASEGAVLRAAAVFIFLFFGIVFEQYLWDQTMNQSSDVKTVSAFEIEEAGLSAVLTDAIRDQRKVVDYLTKEKDRLGKHWMLQTWSGAGERPIRKLEKEADKVAEMQFRAMTVLGLLEATREREAGGVA